MILLPVRRWGWVVAGLVVPLSWHSCSGMPCRAVNVVVCRQLRRAGDRGVRVASLQLVTADDSRTLMLVFSRRGGRRADDRRRHR